MYISVERRKIRQKWPMLEGRSDVLRGIDAGLVTSCIATGWPFGIGGPVGGRGTRSLDCVERDVQSTEVGQSAQIDNSSPTKRKVLKETACGDEASRCAGQPALALGGLRFGDFSPSVPRSCDRHEAWPSTDDGGLSTSASGNDKESDECRTWFDDRCSRRMRTNRVRPC
jgi:hypothetical protein